MDDVTFWQIGVVIFLLIGLVVGYFVAKSNYKSVKETEPKLDYDGKAVWRCGECGNRIFHPSGTGLDEDSMNHYRYCSHCGKPIKWTAWPYAHERKKVYEFEHGM